MNQTHNYIVNTGDVNWSVIPLLLVVLLGIIGNGLVCTAVYAERQLRNTTNYFLVSLSIADLIVCLVVMPCSIASEFIGYWPYGLILCDIWQFLDVTMCTSSIMHMCAISIDRYVGISDPLGTRGSGGISVKRRVLTVWLISLCIACPIVLFSFFDTRYVFSNGQDNNLTQCMVTNRYFLVYGSCTAFFIPLFIMFLAYGATIRLLHVKSLGDSSIRRQMSVTSSHRPMKQLHVSSETEESFQVPLVPTMTQLDNESACVNPTSSGLEQKTIYSASTLNDQTKQQALLRKKVRMVKTEMKAVRVLGTMFILFVICWAPFFILNLTIGLCSQCNVHGFIFKVCLWLGYISSTLNPIIYTIFNVKFKRAFFSLLTCRLRIIK